MSPETSVIGSLHLSVSQVLKATRSFSPSLQSRRGEFGIVYKVQLVDGLVVSIQLAKREFFETLQNEFRSEVGLLSKIDHRSLVQLLAYLEKGNELLIITEYVPNDFGFATLGYTDTDKSHISTKVMGTVGHLDPEYTRTYQLTAKSDAFKKFNEGKVLYLVDSRMGELVNHDILSRTFALAFECAAPIHADRPVGEQLWAIGVDYLKTVTRAS